MSTGIKTSRFSSVSQQIDIGMKTGIVSESSLAGVFGVMTTDDIFTSSALRQPVMATAPELRQLNFDSIDDVVAEAERLASGEVRVTGNHSFVEILNHLAIAQDVSSGRITPPPPPFFMKLMRPFIRMVVFGSKPLKPGVKLPASGESFFWPNTDQDVASAVSQLKESAEYYKANGPVLQHPFFGKVTKQQADQLNCRHGALHLSFVHSV